MSAGQKSRRLATDDSSTPSAKKRRVSRIESSVGDLNELLEQALMTAKTLKLLSGDGPALQVARNLTTSLLDSLPADPTIKAIGYDAHKTSFDKQIKALDKHVRRDYDGYEIQGEMMEKIGKEILDWLPILWRAVSEDGADIKLVCQSLRLCSDAVNRLGNSESQAPFSDMMDNHKIKIMDSKDSKIYEQNSCEDMDGVLAWMWKEVLVISAALGNPTAAILADIQRLGITDDVLKRIRQTGEKTTPEGDSFWDGHWTRAMIDSGVRLCLARHQKQIDTFQQRPSLKLYNTLISKNAELQAPLLDSIRSNVFTTPPSIPSDVAAQIFVANASTADLLRLMESLQPLDSAQIIIAKYLSKQRSATNRAKALKVVEAALNQTKEQVWEELGEVFPQLDDATEWLEEKVEAFKANRQPKKVPGRSNRAPTIDDIVDRFVKRAGQYEDGEPGPLQRRGDPMDGYNSGDSDYEDQRDLREPDLRRPMENWVRLLAEWPDKSATEAIWGRLRFDQPLIVVAGAAEALAADYVQKSHFKLILTALKV
ncbi:hypothetical protein C8J56DRAFT_329532 [Mycena floridula]|nr:hypothetical protein C8J56DRAFT_329532 [Mycena floridula]